MNEVEWCRVCGAFYSESKVDVHSHIMNDHTLRERLDTLCETAAHPEKDLEGRAENIDEKPTMTTDEMRRELDLE